MAPLSAWLPLQHDERTDLILTIAGDGIAGCSKCLLALERTVTDQGFEIMAQHGRLNGRNNSAAVRLRISVQPTTSMGHGCDVLAWLNEEAPDLKQFAVQSGSVLLCEPDVAAQLNAPPAHSGVIVYPVPFNDLTRQCGGCFSGKGAVALGVLAQFLGLPSEVLCQYLEPEYSRRYFDAGLAFAAAHLRKRDLYDLSTAISNPGHVLLNVHEAMALGMASGRCKCPASCLSTLEDSPDAWVARHVQEGARLISSASDVGSIEAYVGPYPGLTVLVGRENPSELVPLEHRSWPIIFVASDIADFLSLIWTAPQFSRASARLVWVIVDGALTRRVESVPTSVLLHVLENHRGNQSTDRAETAVELRPEREGTMHAEVGYVAWGSAQGVVREAVAMCRDHGIDVAALYPKSLPPHSSAQVEAFANTVTKVVIVESSAFSNYTGLVTSTTGLHPSQLQPEWGRALTPMDMFLREGLGCQQTE